MNCSPSCCPALFWPLLPRKLNLYPELQESRSSPARLNTQGCRRGASRLGRCSRFCFEHPHAGTAGTEPTCPGTTPAPVCLQQSTRGRLDRGPASRQGEDQPMETSPSQLPVTRLAAHLHRFEVFTSTLTAFSSRRLRMGPSKCLMNT